MAIFIEKHNSSTIDILTMFQPCIPLRTASSVFKVSGFVNLLRPMYATSVVIVDLVTNPTIMTGPTFSNSTEYLLYSVVIAKPCIDGLW